MAFEVDSEELEKLPPSKRLARIKELKEELHEKLEKESAELENKTKEKIKREEKELEELLQFHIKEQIKKKKKFQQKSKLENTINEEQSVEKHNEHKQEYATQTINKYQFDPADKLTEYQKENITFVQDSKPLNGESLFDNENPIYKSNSYK